jgi:SAM-dependent methyltransferase
VKAEVTVASSLTALQAGEKVFRYGPAARDASRVRQNRGSERRAVTWSYGTLATEVYDIDKPVGSSFGDLEYYSRALEGTVGQILEPAVGTGRILIPLLEAGLDVEGYDTSPEMIATCRANGRRRNLDPVVHEADMTAFVRSNEYAAVIVPAGSIVLLDGRDEVVRALGCFRASLRPGGTLTLDVPAPELIDGSEPTRSWAVEPFVWTLQTLGTQYDPAANQTTRWLRYEKWRDGALVATELQRFRLQHWSIAEFTGLLLSTGFTEITVAGDYQDDRAPDRKTSLWSFQATRA